MVIAIVGAGGKTTVGSHIGKKLAAMGQHALLTTTTKIFMPADEAVYLGNLALIKVESAFMVAANRLLPSGKLEGYSAQDIQTIANLGLKRVIIVEADGAAGRWRAAPARTRVCDLTRRHRAPALGAVPAGRPSADRAAGRLSRHLLPAGLG